MYKKILVPVDGSEKSFRTLDSANILVERLGGKLLVLHVIKQMRQRSDFEADIIADVNKSRKVFSEYVMEKVKKHLGPVILARTEFKHVTSSAVAETIIEVAQKEKCDAIIIGARGLDDVDTMLLGSVSVAVSILQNYLFW